MTLIFKHKKTKMEFTHKIPKKKKKIQKTKRERLFVLHVLAFNNFSTVFFYL